MWISLFIVAMAAALVLSSAAVWMQAEDGPARASF
jgi:hypothetical protein